MTRKKRPEKNDQKNRPEKPTRKTDQKKVDQKQLEDRIIDMIKINAFVSRNEIAEAIGISDSAVKRKVERLVKEGRLLRVGPNKGGRWELIE